MKQLSPGFRIIEILISGIIISRARIPGLKIQTENHEQIVYISERNKRALQDSLYLSSNILQHHQDNKTAYEILERSFKIKEQESREILRKSSRDVFIPEERKILSLEEQGGPSAIVNEVMLKDKHSSNYYHFQLEGF